MKVTLIYSSTSKQLLFLYKNFIKKTLLFFKAKNLIINVPTKRKVKTFLKSPHVNKRSKENFEIKIFKFKVYTQLNIPFIKSFRYNVPKNIHLKIIYYI